MRFPLVFAIRLRVWSADRAGSWVVALLIACASAVLGCSRQPYVWVQSLPKQQAAATHDGRIAVGDVVRVQVFGQETLTTQGTVRPDGTLTLPLLGPVAMAGQRPAELASALGEQFRRFVTDPHVTVVIMESQVSVTAVGEVRQPGVVMLDAPSSVLQALARSGGMTEFADASGIFVLRAAGSTTLRIRFRYQDLVRGVPAAIGFQLKTGDVLVVE